MIKHVLFSLSLIVGAFTVSAQCDSTNVPNNYTISSDLLMSGTYVVNGTFTIASGATVYVTPYGTNSCGKLTIYADNIVIEGTINGDFAGFEGGAGGSRGTVASSITGHEIALVDCTDSGSEGQVSVAGGSEGAVGNGPGGGNAGSGGLEGSGPKQYCGNFGDEAGLIGGAGGAGGGAGGSYGGAGSAGSDGGAGSGNATTDGLDIETAYAVIGGNGGAGGSSIATYGTATDRDIELGSGGAGAGGGGRSYYLGTNGGNGGNGGGLVILITTGDLSVTGTITTAGAPGNAGGDGGSGDATADCCSDGCNGCDERTFSAGAGSGSGGGGGSGGGIFLESYGNATVTGTLNVSGGDGGAAGQNGGGANCTYSDFFCGDQSITAGNGTTGGQGGAGGGGRIKIYVSECANATLNPTTQLNGGTGNQQGGVGTYEEVCGYVGLNEAEQSIGWSVHPNPFENTVTVEILSGHAYADGAQIEVHNALGQKVFGSNVTDTQMTIDLSAVPTGMYTVRLLTDSHVEINRIIKK